VLFTLPVNRRSLFSPTFLPPLPICLIILPMHSLQTRGIVLVLHQQLNITLNSIMSIEPSYPNRAQKGKVLAGLILLFVGAAFLVNELDFMYFPHWIFRPATFWLVLALYLGAKDNFRKPLWVIVAFLAGLSVIDNIFPFFNLSKVAPALAVIGVGVWLLLGRKHNWGRKAGVSDSQSFDKANFDNPFEPKFKADPTDPNYDANAPEQEKTYYAPNTPPGGHGDDVIDTVSVFGSVKRTILSKNFRGGEIVNVFGGTDLDLTQADIYGRVVIDVTQLFGGIKLYVPPHWQVVSDLAAVFSGVDDKRRNIASVPLSTDKILVIKGVSIFAGVEIRSF